MPLGDHIPKASGILATLTMFCLVWHHLAVYLFVMLLRRLPIVVTWIEEQVYSREVHFWQLFRWHFTDKFVLRNSESIPFKFRRF